MPMLDPLCNTESGLRRSGKADSFGLQDDTFSNRSAKLEIPAFPRGSENENKCKAQPDAVLSQGNSIGSCEGQDKLQPPGLFDAHLGPAAKKGPLALPLYGLFGDQNMRARDAHAYQREASHVDRTRNNIGEARILSVCTVAQSK